MIAMVFAIFAASLISGGFRSKSCLKKMDGEFFNAPSALVAQILSMTVSFSEKNLGIGRFIHAATV